MSIDIPCCLKPPLLTFTKAKIIVKYVAAFLISIFISRNFSILQISLYQILFKTVFSNSYHIRVSDKSTKLESLIKNIYPRCQIDLLKTPLQNNRNRLYRWLWDQYQFFILSLSKVENNKVNLINVWPCRLVLFGTVKRAL